MNSEELQKANKLNASITLINELEADAENFKKKLYSGSLPSSAVRYLSGNGDLAYDVLIMIKDRAIIEREGLQKQLSEL